MQVNFADTTFEGLTMLSPWKTIQEHLGRSKNFLNKRKAVRSIVELAEAVKLFIFHEKQINPQQRIEFEIRVQELTKSLNILPELQEFFRKPLTYKKTMERALYMELSRIVKKISASMEDGSGEKAAKARAEEKSRREAMLDKLESYLRKKDVIMAGSTIQKITEELGHEPGVVRDIADRYYRAGMTDEAIEYARKAIEVDPQDMPSYKVLVNAYRKIKEYGKAVAVYQKAVEAFGKHPSIYLNMAKLYYEWGKEDRAYKCAKIVLKIEPDHMEALDFVESYEKKHGQPQGR